MKAINFFSIKMFVIPVSLIMLGCALTIKDPKKPQFLKDEAIIKRELSNFIKFENVEYKGIEAKSGDEVSSSLTVNIINCKDVSTDELELSKLSQIIGSHIKYSLKDPHDFDFYTILFVTTIDNNNEKSSKYIGKKFEDDELPKPLN